MNTAELTTPECDVIIKEAGYTMHIGYTGDKKLCHSQTIGLDMLRNLVRYSFKSGADHERRKTGNK